MFSARLDPPLMERLATPPRRARADAPVRAVRPFGRLDAADRAPGSAAAHGRGAAVAAAILLHAGLLAGALCVAFRVPAEPVPMATVPLVFEPSAAFAAPAVPPAPPDVPPAPPDVTMPAPATAPPAVAPPTEAAPPAAEAPALPAPAPAESAPAPPPPVTPPPIIAQPAPPRPLEPPAAAGKPPEIRRPEARQHDARPAEAKPEHLAPRGTHPASRTRPAATAEAHEAAPVAPARIAPAGPASPAPAPTAPAAPAGPLVPPRAVAGVAGNRRPIYPSQARERGEEGTVVVRVQVSAQGAAEAVAVARSSGHPALDAAALAALRTWRFSPATRGGVAVAAQAEVPIAFHLDD